MSECLIYNYFLMSPDPVEKMEKTVENVSAPETTNRGLGRTLKDGKKWKITSLTSLLGAGKVKLQPGEVVVQLEPPEDDFVLVQTKEGKIGSIAVRCAGNQILEILMTDDDAFQCSEEVIKIVMRVIQEKKLIGNHSVTVSVGDLVEQVESADENGLITVRTASGETGLIKERYLGTFRPEPASSEMFVFHLESTEHVLRIKVRQRLLGCLEKILLEPGDQVYQVEPEESLHFILLAPWLGKDSMKHTIF